MNALDALKSMTLEEFFDAQRQYNEKKVLLNYKEVSAITGLSVPTIRKLVDEGHFPKPFMGEGKQGSSVRFLRAEVEDLKRVQNGKGGNSNERQLLAADLGRQHSGREGREP